MEKNKHFSRAKAISQNIGWGLLAKVIALALSFGSKTIFIYSFGKQLLGVNSLYTEVLSMLSLAELGFASAFTFALYKPIAYNNNEKVIQILCLFKKIYRIIAILVLGIGVLLIPFLPYIAKDAVGISNNQLRIYFLFFLFNTVVNYFVQYKLTYVNAKMENYVVTNLEMVTNAVCVVLQIISMIIFNEYLIYLVIQSIVTVMSRFFISIYLDKRYAVFNKISNIKLEECEKKEIYNDVKGLALQNFASVAIHSTDNMIISLFSGMGVVGVGLVSNYNLLITSVTAFTIVILTSVTSSFGNVVATESQQCYEDLFLEANFYTFWLYGFCSIAFCSLIPPFIQLWLGDGFQIDNVSFWLIVFNTYLQGKSTIYNNARCAKGQFNRDKWISVIQALVNLIVSVIAAKLCGLPGVYIGTVVSRLFFFVARPIKTYRFLFGSSVYRYFKQELCYFIITAFAGIITVHITNIVLVPITVLRFVIACAIVLLIPNIIFLVFFGKTSMFAKLRKRVHLLNSKGG